MLAILLVPLNIYHLKYIPSSAKIDVGDFDKAAVE